MRFLWPLPLRDQPTEVASVSYSVAPASLLQAHMSWQNYITVTPSADFSTVISYRSAIVRGIVKARRDYRGVRGGRKGERRPA